MSAESDALADALTEPRYCTGCGHDERVIIDRTCCPDSRYRTVKQILDERQQFSVEADNARKEVWQLKKALSDQKMRNMQIRGEPRPPAPVDFPEWTLRGGPKNPWRAE